MYIHARKGACKMRPHPCAQPLRGIHVPLCRRYKRRHISFPHCFVTNDVVEWRVSNSGSIRSAQEHCESSLSSLISCRDKSWESYSAREGGRGGLLRFITLSAYPPPPPPLVIFFRPFIGRSY